MKRDKNKALVVVFCSTISCLRYLYTRKSGITPYLGSKNSVGIIGGLGK